MCISKSEIITKWSGTVTNIFLVAVDSFSSARTMPVASATCTVLLQIFARSLFLRILRVNLQSQKYDRNNYLAGCGWGQITYIHVHVAASCEKDEYQQPLQPCWTQSDREEHSNRRSGYPRAKRTGVSSACWESSRA